MSQPLTNAMTQQREKERWAKLQQANLDLYFASKRMKYAEEELNEAEREHSAAVRRVEELEQAE